jgi:hypothetical protein
MSSLVVIEQELHEKFEVAHDPTSVSIEITRWRCVTGDR